MDWGSYGFVIGSEHRKKVVYSLTIQPKSPKQISESTGLRMSHISKALRELESFGVIVCLTPKLRKGRLFGLTELGKQVASRLDTKS